MTFWAKSFLSSKFKQFIQKYKDVHERNVIFKIRPIKQKGVIIIAKNYKGKVKMYRVGLQPIEERLNLYISHTLSNSVFYTRVLLGKIMQHIPQPKCGRTKAEKRRKYVSRYK
ncbi:MAG: hypothetical protein ACOCRO_05780 [Halanaerobiales bacterium]